MTCPTVCDADCDQPCHEIHTPRWRREHQPQDCPAFLARPLPVSQHDVAYSSFPITIELYRVDTGEIVWTETVEQPRAVEIPALGRQYATPIGARVRYATGETAEELP